MTSPRFPMTLLAVLLGTLFTPAFAQVDTSQWKCESCPYPKGTQGVVEGGIATVSDDSAKFGDFTGLQRDGAHLQLGASLLHRADSGYFADLTLGDRYFNRTLAARTGREGLYSLHLGFTEIPRHFADGAQTPFSGVGSGVLTLPAGFAATTTAGMPLAATLQPVELGYKWRRFDLGGSVIVGTNWTVGVSLRRDERDGTRGLYSSFFSTAAALPAPVDHVTDQFEVAAAYASRQLQARLAFQLSEFHNATPSLTWDNPFILGSTRGQLALAPDNRLQQVLGSAGYALTPGIRISGDFAVGRLTQNEPYLASTLNPGLVVPALPVPSLDGRVDTFNGSVRVSAATPIDGLRVTASYTHDLRDNKTGIQSYPSVSTDMFVGLSPARSNTPTRQVLDRVKLGADWRGPGTLRLAGGVDVEQRERRYSEAVETDETTVWARGSIQATEQVALSAKVAHAERDHSTYGVATWLDAPENPLLRKYHLAERSRDSIGLRADLSLNDKLSVGLGADYADDRYDASVVGLQSARNTALHADLTFAMSEQTRFTLYAQGEEMRSRQAGSQSFAAPDWTARGKDRFEIIGLGVAHAAIPDKLDLGAELTVTRARSDITTATGVGEEPFPTAKTDTDSLRLYANYKLSDKWTVLGSYWYERQAAQDWRLDGVLPATVSNLLVFGEQAPRYQVHLLRVVLRYRF